MTTLDGGKISSEEFLSDDPIVWIGRTMDASDVDLCNLLLEQITMGASPEELVKVDGVSEKIELASCVQNLREVNFYFPIPSNGSFESKDFETLKKEAEMKLWDWNVEKGFLRGSIDFVFEHKSRIYLIDWKSNKLEDYYSKTLGYQVKTHYMLQLQIYTLAVTYWFNLDNKEKFEKMFGGVLYIFLRGMPQKEGVFFFRPDWIDVLDYKRILSLEKH